MKSRIMACFAPKSARVVALTTFLTLGLSACEVTDLQPKDAIPESSAFSTPERVTLAVTGVYNAAQSGFYDALNGTALGTRGYPFGAAANALGDARGEDVIDIAGFFLIVYSNNITTASPNLVNMWLNLYAVINQSNIVIAGLQSAVQSGVITQETANIAEGEVRFLRALSYHELIINFSKPFTDNNGNNPGVPYRDTPTNTVSAIEQARTVDRGTVANIYTKILEDLNFAEQNLPATGSKVRATKGAAIALKQRVHLHKADWAAAKAEGDKLISGTTTFTSPIGAYTLQATPEAASPGRTNTTSESIFSIENSADDNATTNGSLGSIFGSPNSATQPAPDQPGISGRGLLAVSPNLYNATFWPCNDRRRTGLLQLARDGRYYLFKYKDAATYTDYAPIIRYAEVILNQAEAEARLNNTTQGLALLNVIRNRAVPEGPGRYTAFASSVELTRAILNERRIELLGEGFRWDDIHRLSRDPQFSPVSGGGIPSKLGTAQATAASYTCASGTTIAGTNAVIPYTDYRFLWPIPSTEIANNPTLAGQQNPGY